MSRVGKIAFLYDATYTQKKKTKFPKESFLPFNQKANQLRWKKIFFYLNGGWPHWKEGRK